MGSTTDKVSGGANQAAGKVKETAGKATGSTDLEAEGLAQQAKGKAEKLAGDAKLAAKDAANKVAPNYRGQGQVMDSYTYSFDYAGGGYCVFHDALHC
jgi:uncharacterized protein YjbJ (UPF0337 family)